MNAPKINGRIIDRSEESIVQIFFSRFGDRSRESLNPGINTQRNLFPGNLNLFARGKWNFNLMEV